MISRTMDDPPPARNGHPAPGGRELAVAFASFLALASLLLWRAWTPRAADRLLIGGPEGDFIRQALPWRLLVARDLAAGQLPLWNPHVYAGTPLWADPQPAVLYPLRLLQLPMAFLGPGAQVLVLVGEAMLHLALAGAATFLLLRMLGAQRLPAAMGAAAFGLGGYLTGYPLDQLPILGSAAWIPLALAALVAATRTDDRLARRRWVFVAATASALGLLAGHAQTVAFGVAAGVAWLLACGIAAVFRQRAMPGDGTLGDGPEVPRDRRLPVVPSPGQVAWLAATWLALAAALAAAQWLPTATLVAASTRTLSAEEILRGLPVGDLRQLVAPHALSRWSPLYIGMTPLVLLLWGVLRAPATRFWAGVSAVAGLWALGGHGPLVPLILRAAPGLLPFRHQERAAVLVALAGAVAAGLAAEALLARRARPARATHEVAAVATVLAAGLILGAALSWTGGSSVEGASRWSLADGLAHGAMWAAATAVVLVMAAVGRLPGRRLGIALLAITLLDLLTANTGHALGPWPEGGPYAHSPVVEALRERARDGRVSSEGLLPGGANAAIVHGLYDVTGDSPLHLAATGRLVEEAPELAWWRLLGVRYVLRDRPLGAAEAQLLQPLVQEPERQLYEVQLPAPPVWVTGRTRCVEALERWRPAADFDPRLAVVVERANVAALAAASAYGTADGTALRCMDEATRGANPGAAPGGGDVAAGPDAGVAGVARLVGLDANRASVEAELPEPAWLVWSSARGRADGWRVVATGEDGGALRADPVAGYGVLPSVWLPAGRWRVEWTYRPRAVILGGAISGVALSVMLLGSLRTGRLPWRRRGRARRA